MFVLDHELERENETDQICIDVNMLRNSLNIMHQIICILFSLRTICHLIFLIRAVYGGKPPSLEGEINTIIGFIQDPLEISLDGVHTTVNATDLYTVTLSIR